MNTEFDRWQYRQERAQRMAREELTKLAATPAADIVPSTDWDATFAELLDDGSGDPTC